MAAASAKQRIRTTVALDASPTGCAGRKRLHPRRRSSSVSSACARWPQRLGLPAPALRTLTVAGTNGKGSSADAGRGDLPRRRLSRRPLHLAAPAALQRAHRDRRRAGQRRRPAVAPSSRSSRRARRRPLTYFEFGTLAALWLFREAAVDVQVLEVGLGGRLDAVNLVDADAALITNIGLDHTDWLGPDRESIGREKAGMLRAGRPAICVDRASAGSRCATRRGASARRCGSSGATSTSRPRGERWHWHGARARVRRACRCPGCAGAMQLRNAAGVIAARASAARAAAGGRSGDSRGAAAAGLPGRFERVGDVILDVAHNVEAAAVLADNLRALERARRIRLVLGMLARQAGRGVRPRAGAAGAMRWLAGLPGPRGLAARNWQRACAPAAWTSKLCADVPARWRAPGAGRRRRLHRGHRLVPDGGRRAGAARWMRSSSGASPARWCWSRAWRGDLAAATGRGAR